MSALKKIMNDEIKKYQDRIYYLDIEKDIYGNLKKPRIESANWIFNTSCYDHYSFELHHVIKFTHYEHNKNWYEKNGLKMCLILIPKVMHQHLENPMYELPDDVFFEKYQIHKWELLFNKVDFEQGNFPKILAQSNDFIGFDGCFDCLEGVCP